MRRRALFSRPFQSFLWKLVPPMLRPAIVVQNLANARRWRLDRRAEKLGANAGGRIAVNVPAANIIVERVENSRIARAKIDRSDWRNQS